MGIYVDLYRMLPAPYYERARHKLQYCIEAVKFFQKGLFSLQDAELWLYAPGLTLGGTLKATLKTPELFSANHDIERLLSSLSYDELSQSFVVFNGIWNFGDVKLGGYFAVSYNESWSEVYHEIEIEAFAKKDYEDLVDALWETQDMVALSKKFIEALQKMTVNRSLGIGQILFSRGVPTEEDPTNLMCAHLAGERKGLLRLFYLALAQTKDPEVAPKLPALNRTFFITTLDREEIVHERLSSELQDSLIIESKGGSATYIAKDRNSFAKLFKEVSETIMKPALKELPTADHVRGLIESGLKEGDQAS